ncbi:MAG: T9SS type A sorting domain-containing protein [Ignavibacteriaceae bacterium]|nr:T9SS type A sorting domain-containing protein [Ignavibacteriaceae bacterium]MCZ7615684.1 T9SS type A sorting domain-containing protein [Ignavibacteriaceae bacterium]
MVTIKYDSDGDSVWVKRYNGEASDIDEGVDIEVDASGNIYAAGSSTGITTALDYTTIKYDDSGTENWSIKYTNSGAAGSEEQLTGIFVDASSNVYVTGMSALDYATIKYVQSPTSIDDENSQSPDEFFLDQNYPNPFNPSTKIRFVIAIRQLPEKQSQMVLLKVYDVLGNEVATLVDEYLPAGSYEVEFGRHSDESANGGQNLSSGIYFYRLQVGSFVETKKMLMLK